MSVLAGTHELATCDVVAWVDLLGAHGPTAYTSQGYNQPCGSYADGARPHGSRYVRAQLVVRLPTGAVCQG